MHWEHNTVMKEKTLTKYNLIYCRKTAIKNFPIKFLSPHESIDSPHFNPQCRLATINGISITVNNIVKEKKTLRTACAPNFFSKQNLIAKLSFFERKKNCLPNRNSVSCSLFTVQAITSVERTFWRVSCNFVLLNGVCKAWRYKTQSNERTEEKISVPSKVDNKLH